ncbi:MAG TPA: hypothetical protein LFW21_05180 [Rickettsia endosymbiont of Pyrocoelia pectoralis]|nr:hypothetical protein [Rickettsia endosymbiont of Pyrocoelia pectoralis]
MTILFQFINEFKFTEAVRAITKDNVNERGNIVFRLNFNGTESPCAATNVNALEALCFMNSVLSLTSTSQEQLRDRVNILKNCI